MNAVPGLVTDASRPTSVHHSPSEASSADTVTLRLDHGGVAREALLYIPESYRADTSSALMLNFHGFGGTAADHIAWADMRSLADRDGALLVYPQGSELDGSPHWNAAPDTPDNKSNVDDLGFVRALVEQIGVDYPFDTDRVYASGYSNGGMMAFALACYASDLVAAIGVVSGQQLDDSDVCAPTHPTGVITLHGTSDSVLSYEGDGVGLAAQDAIDFWVAYNGAEVTPQTSAESDDGVTIEHVAYTGGRGGASVEHYRYVGGGHVWFERSFEGAGASQLVWNFVIRHDINGAR